MLIRFDTSSLAEYAETLARLNAESLAKVRVMAVNAVSLTVREKAISATHEELNLSRSYIEGRIARDEATGTTASARLTTQIRGATLQRFGAQQQTKTVNWTNDRIQQMGKKFGAWPGWTERKGDPSRGIAANSKAAGVAVDVNRKGDKIIASAFTMPLRNGNGTGVFRRENGTVKHLYGPSVYQTFRRYLAVNEEQILDELETDFTDRLDELIEESLP